MSGVSVKAPYRGIKVFSSTMVKEREYLGEKVSDWIATNRDKEVVETVVTQSSDSEFHCFTITVFYR